MRAPYRVTYRQKTAGEWIVATDTTDWSYLRNVVAQAIEYVETGATYGIPVAWAHIVDGRGDLVRVVEWRTDGKRGVIARKPTTLDAVV